MPYSDPGDQFDMTSEQRNHLRRRIPLLTYLEKQGWKPAADIKSDEVCGRCPLHVDSRPSFYVNRRKDVFFCHGSGQGGDVIRLAQLMHRLDFRTALATLARQEEEDGRQLWKDACSFYQAQLHRDCEAQAYLDRRGIGAETVDRMRIGYAPGGCLRAYLEELGYSRAAIVESGLTDTQGRDRLRRAITFPRVQEFESTFGGNGQCVRPQHRSHGGPASFSGAIQGRTVRMETSPALPDFD